MIKISKILLPRLLLLFLIFCLYKFYRQQILLFELKLFFQDRYHKLNLLCYFHFNIKNKKWADDFSVIDPDGTSYVDSYYSKAYLRHLIASKEILGAQIATLHNLSFYIWLVEEARAQIIAGTFYNWKKEMVKQLAQKL